MNPTSNPDPTPNPTPEQMPNSAPEPASTSVPPTPIEPKPATPKTAIWIALGVLFLALIGFGVYAWGQAVEQKNNDAVIMETDEVKTETEAPVVEDAATITTTLPNGKTATYANTEGNRNFEFSDSDLGMNYVALSHKAVANFIASIDETMLTKLCGANGELAQRDDIIVATMSTSVRSVQYPTENSCLDELATLRNTDPATRAAAAELVKQVETDIRQFYAKVIIQ